MLKTGNFRTAAPIFGRNGQMEASILLTKEYANMKPGDGAKLVGLVRQAAEELSLAPAAPAAPATGPRKKAKGKRQARR
jgi:DNA-binding IclR family transcriptional regulator